MNPVASYNFLIVVLADVKRTAKKDNDEKLSAKIEELELMVIDRLYSAYDVNISRNNSARNVA
jgi:hypothetical protein